jgi:hypothetical protein
MIMSTEQAKDVCELRKGISCCLRTTREVYSCVWIAFSDSREIVISYWGRVYEGRRWVQKRLRKCIPVACIIAAKEYKL